MVKFIKDITRLGVGFLKIMLFFLPIIALISSFMGIMGMMMGGAPPLEMGMDSPPSGGELNIPVNYSIENPSNFQMYNYELQLGMEINDTFNDEVVTVWSNSLNVGDIAAGETTEGQNELLTITFPDEIDFDTKTYNVSMAMKISFKTALGLVPLDIVAPDIEQMEIGPDADGGGH